MNRGWEGGLLFLFRGEGGRAQKLEFKIDGIVSTVLSGVVESRLKILITPFKSYELQKKQTKQQDPTERNTSFQVIVIFNRIFSTKDLLHRSSNRLLGAT